MTTKKLNSVAALDYQEGLLRGEQNKRSITSKKRTTAISPAARRIIRTIRYKLGRAIYGLNESEFIETLYDKYKGGVTWSEAEIDELIDRMLVLSDTVRREAGKISKMLKDDRLKIQPQTRKKLESSVEALKGAYALLLSAKEYPKDYRGEDFELYASVFFFGKERDERGRVVARGRYSYAIRTIRLSVNMLYYTVTARDGQNVVLSPLESKAWKSGIARKSSKKAFMVYAKMAKDFQDWANEEGITVYVFDEDKELVGTFPPLSHLAGEDQRSNMVRSALAQSKEARQHWGSRWRESAPTDVTTFKESLTDAQKRKVSDFLARHPDRSFSIYEIAALADAKLGKFERQPVSDIGEELTESGFTPNADADSTADAIKDIGLMQAIWKMDIP